MGYAQRHLIRRHHRRFGRPSAGFRECAHQHPREHAYIYYIGTDMHAHQITWASGGTWVTLVVLISAESAVVPT
jgi:hypothetical protein